MSETLRFRGSRRHRLGRRLHVHLYRWQSVTIPAGAEVIEGRTNPFSFGSGHLRCRCGKWHPDAPDHVRAAAPEDR